MLVLLVSSKHSGDLHQMMVLHFIHSIVQRMRASISQPALVHQWPTSVAEVEVMLHGSNSRGGAHIIASCVLLWQTKPVPTCNLCLQWLCARWQLGLSTWCSLLVSCLRSTALLETCCMRDVLKQLLLIAKGAPRQRGAFQL